METPGRIFLTHPSFITTIAAAFTILSGLFLLLLKRKSRATADLAGAFLSSSFTTFAFTIAFVYYHPAAALHRWLTVTPVLVTLLFMTRFFFHFPYDIRPRTVAWLTAALVAFAAADGALWMRASYHFERIFQGDAEIWDIQESRFAAVNAAIISLYIFLVIAAGTWRCAVTRGRDRWKVLALLFAFVVVIVIPGIANALARQGSMDRESFIITTAMVTVLGWFITLMFYIGFTSDSTPIMARITGISLVTILVALMGISRITGREYEKHYDELRLKDTDRFLSDTLYRPPDCEYIVLYRAGGVPVTLFSRGNLPAASPLIHHYENALALDALLAATGGTRQGLIRALGGADRTFAGFKNSLEMRIAAIPAAAPITTADIAGHMRATDRFLSHHRYRVRTLETDSFRTSIEDYLEDTPESFAPFRNAIRKRLAGSAATGSELREEVLALLTPPPVPGLRFLRSGGGGRRHFNAYLAVDRASHALYEIAFSYAAYRRAMHASALSMYLILGGVLVMVLAGFPLFMRSSLTRPLAGLVRGLEKVGNGNFDVVIPVGVEDEIGFLSRSFNGMVQSIRLANQERAIAEEALRMAEARFRGLVEQSLAGIYVIQDGRFVYINPKFAGIFGYSADEILNLPSALDIVADDDRAAVAETIRMRETGGSRDIRYTYRGRKKDGAIIHLESHGTGMEIGGQQAVIGTVIDISDSRRTRLALIQEKERLLITLGSIGDGVIATDVAGNITIINSVAQEMTGCRFPDAIGEHINTIYHTLDEVSQQRCPNPVELIIGKGIPGDRLHSAILVSRNGSRRIVSERGAPIRDREGRLIGVVLVFRDITAERESGRELARMRLLLKNMIDSMPSILIGVDAGGKIIYWNKQAEDYSGLPEKEAAGRPLAEVFPALRGQLDRVKTAVFGKAPQKPERMIITRDGEVRHYETMVYPLIAAGAEGAVLRLDDITSRLRMEEMIIQTEKMVSLGGLAAGMAHEINNPLGGIIMGSQNILRRLSGDLPKNRELAAGCGADMDRIADYMEKRGITAILQGILEMGGRASGIVENMLSFSRKSESRKSTADMAELVEKSLELASNDYDLKKKYDFRHIEIIRDFEPGLPLISCVKMEMQQVLLNLLKNAAFAIGQKRYEKERPRITLRLRREDNRIRLEVEDNGIGMDTETRKRIFEPFFTTKELGFGTGLGLSVSYFIITNNHGGSMEVESAHRRGTTFIILLPVG